MSYVTIAVRIPRELKELLDRYGIDLGEVIRRALEHEVKRRIVKEAERELQDVIDKISMISDEEIARLIREDRDNR